MSWDGLIIYVEFYYVHLLLTICYSSMEMVEGDYDSFVASFKNTVIYAIFITI